MYFILFCSAFFRLYHYCPQARSELITLPNDSGFGDGAFAEIDSTLNDTEAYGDSGYRLNNPSEVCLASTFLYMGIERVCKHFFFF